jgi:transcription-repair coupling factor (superfamily II helicase)
MVSRFVSPKDTSGSSPTSAPARSTSSSARTACSQRDVIPKELGLVILDEEQRFGVAQKELLKSLRLEVDVLTLSATPIPRTLHLSLAGMRDISIIETPPRAPPDPHDRSASTTRSS